MSDFIENGNSVVPSQKSEMSDLDAFSFLYFFFGFLGELGYVLSLFDARTGSRHV